MFLIQEKRKKGTNLCIVQSYRDPVTKVSKTKRILNIGYIEDLKEKYPDPVAHFKQVAKEMTDEQLKSSAPKQISLDLSLPLEPNSDHMKNYGYAALSSIYHQLELDTFFRMKKRDARLNYSLNNIMKLFVYSHILFPSADKRSYYKKDKFFDKMDFSLEDIQSSCTQFHRYKMPLQDWTYRKITANYGKETGIMYYYMSNQYFEVDDEDIPFHNLCPNKTRMDPIVQLGLLVNNKDLPLGYELCARGPEDKLLCKMALDKAKSKYDAEKVIVVADNGNNQTDYLFPLITKGNGYIVCQNIRSSSKEDKSYVLDQKDYIPFNRDCKVKSRIRTKTARIPTGNGSKKTVLIKERQIVFFNEKFKRWARSERESIVLKANSLISPTYKDLRKEKKATTRPPIRLDEDQIYDGYYIMLTSELDASMETIMGAYYNLWEIDDSFKISDPTFDGRAKSVSRKDYMHTYFTTCLISLQITRILRLKTNNKYPLHEMVSSMKKCNYVHIADNYYAQTYFDPVLNHIGDSTGIDFSKKFGTLSSIRSSIGITKK